MRAKQKRKKSILVRLLVIGVSVYMVVTLSGLWNTLNQKRIEAAALQEQIAVKNSEIEELNSLLADGSQAELVEKAARDRLGYVYADEEVFIDISGN